MRPCKQILAISCLLISFTYTVFAATSTSVSFVDGTVTVKPATGTVKDLDIGDQLKIGDTVRTGSDGTAELDQKGVILKINPKTVFTLSERESGGQKRDVVAVAVGSMKLKYEKLSGQEPLIRTASCSAGVRGTEITVFSGEDGASLIAVTSGSVEISAEGQTVALGVGEAVEVRPGQAPGNKFEVKSDQVDYRSWNDDRVKVMLADPVRAMAELTTLLDSYIRDTTSYATDHQQYQARLADELAKLRKLRETEGEDAFVKYRDETYTPLTLQTANLILNTRFYALAALSLRRYVAGRLYLQLKPLAISGQASYNAFLDSYQEFLDKFEQSIVPQLVEADI